MYWRYSSRVVAPMHRSSPRPSMGLSRLPASIPPPPPPLPPAPTTVWISSMKRMIPPSESVTSFITALSLSSNSPRNLAPAIKRPMSSDITRTPWSERGTSPCTILRASPSEMAVLPTPGSPMSTGLFLLLLERIWMVLRISSSRPMTGSSLPALASAVRSRAYLLRDSYLPSAPWSVTVVPPLSLMTAFLRASSLRPSSAMSALPTRSSLQMAMTRCSTATKSSPMAALRTRASSTRASRWRPRTCWPPPLTLGCLEMKRSMNPTAAEGSTPAWVRMRSAKESFCSNMALHRCSVSTICCCELVAISGASTIASHARSVNSFCEIFFAPPSAETRTATRERSGRDEGRNPLDLTPFAPRRTTAEGATRRPTTVVTAVDAMAGIVILDTRARARVVCGGRGGEGQG